MRKLILLLLAFIAIATFFSAYGGADAGTITDMARQAGIEAGMDN